MSADKTGFDEVEIRLWDSQWVNVVNADYSNMDKDEAIAEAIKATEIAMARNFNENKWPPRRQRL